MPIIDLDISNDALRIKLHIYDVFTICSKHGTVGLSKLKCDVSSCSNYENDKVKPAKLSRRNMLTLK